ncbi:MAG TPA: UPF0182 family protein [Desulfobacteraceae bacterium]|nr:UPF0182 family protein [Desulfobacteraceae bacterium]
MRSKSTIVTISLSVIAFLALCSLLVGYYGDWLWFQNMGFGAVFTTILWTKILAFVVFSIISGLFAWGNIAIARKWGTHTRTLTVFAPEQQMTLAKIAFGDRYAKYSWAGIILFFSFIMGSRAAAAWEIFLQFLHASKFGITDPIFSKDVGFYIFHLPLYDFILGWYLFCVVVVLLAVAASYFMDRSIAVQENHFSINKRAQSHLTILGGLLFLGIALSFRLKLYALMYSNSGVAFGASYADVYAQIPAYWTVLIISLIVALISFLTPLLNRWKFLLYSIGIYFVVLLGFSWVYPALIEQYVVKPTELTKETPYIRHSIKFTRQAFGLNKIKEKPFPVGEPITYKDIKDNQATIHNIRLWDTRPLIETYRQLQEMRLYYNFKNVDIDRYHFKKKYTEVALAARELAPSKLPARARTWLNIHLKYTHGYGLVMSPVNEITKDGLPALIVKNIPPSSNVLSISRPEIYYGEQTSQYVLVNTKTKEFDYPKGNHNLYTSYQGKGGVQLSNLFRRLVYTWNFSDIKILLTNYVTDQSRIMFHRDISDRDHTIAPFLSYDSDPYLVVGKDGSLYWIHDAYTTSTMFPYSQPLSRSQNNRGINYIRNSVKVVINAYNGDVSYYVIDPADPLIQTYEKMFPTLFKPISRMPAFLRSHIRYPKDLFLIQAEMYKTFHMTNPQVFYNQEDLWSLPTEIYNNSEQSMLPYYIIMKLPDTKSEEFMLMLPFTPSKKNNMVAWLSARCDGSNYGQLLEYRLSKEKLIYGPLQIDARINQKPDISSKLTLWGQMGSSVIRGNLLVIPIDHSFLYVEPVYLQSEQSKMPELKRVIVALGDQLQMRDNLDDALRAVFSVEAVPAAQIKKALTGLPTGPLSGMAQKALDHYNKAQDYLKKADWTKYGQELDKIKDILQRMTQKKQSAAGES